MAAIRDYAVTLNTVATASMVCEMPTHVSGDILLAFVNKDTASAFTTPANWNAIRTVLSAGAAGGVYMKRATSSSEAVTFALTIETCQAVVIAVKDAEAEVTSGSTTTTVVAAALTYTRSAGNFITDGFSVGQTVIWSGFANAGNNGPKEIVSITSSGGTNNVMTVTSVSALVNESGTGDEVCTSTGLDKSAASGADDSTLPLAGIGLTPVANNTLVFHGLSGDLLTAPSAYPGWVNLYAGDVAANALCVAYTAKRTAGAITAPNHWAQVADDTRGVIVAVRDHASALSFSAYVPQGTTPATLVSPLVGISGTVDRGTWELVTNDITSVGGKTMGQVDFVSVNDVGQNPFRAATRVIAISSQTNLTASEMRFTSPEDMTAQAGVLFGTWRFQIPRDYLDTGKPASGGVLLGIADAENDHKFWTLGAQFSLTTKPADRQNYAIQVNGASDTSFATSGTISYSSINDLYLAGNGYYGAQGVEWSELYLLNQTELAGGSAAAPMGFDEIVNVVNRGSGLIPLLVQSGSSVMCWTRLRFGGTEEFHADVDLRTFQYPTKADEVDYLDFHVDNSHMGFEFYGLSGDHFTFTNSVFTSASPYYWRFNASHSGGATLDFSGSTVINATVTLRSTSDLSGVTFINCPTFTQNAASLDGCSFSGTKVSASAPADVALITNCDFVSAGSGHAIEIGGSAASFELSGCTFTGYSGTGTDAAIYVNIESGTMTITITGGGSTPSIRTAGATVNVVNNTTVTLTGLVNGSEVRVYDTGTNAVLAGTESVSGNEFAFSDAVSNVVYIRIFHVSYLPADITDYTIPASDASVPVQQIFDRVYAND